MSKPILTAILVSPRLPTLPAVALQVLELTRRPQVKMDDVARVIRNDQALSIKVLRTVNSSYYGLSKPCHTIKQAIVYLGMNTVKTIVLGFSLVESINGGEGDTIAFDFVGYWRRAMLSAVAAREIAAAGRRVDPEEAFLGALMQDIGMVAMFRVLGDRYIQAIDMSGGNHDKLASVEQKAFEIDHAAVGSEIAAKWRLPQQFVDVIRHHHESCHAPQASLELAKAIELAGVAASVAESEHAQARMARLNRDAAGWFDLTTEQTAKIMTVMSQAAKELATLFRVDIGKLPDMQTLLERAEDDAIDHQAQMAAAQAADQPRAPAGATHGFDSLTGAQSAGAFDAGVKRLFEHAMEGTSPLGLIFVDVDHFVRITQEHGSEAGEVVLAEIGRRLAGATAGGPALYRRGHDQFAVLLPASDRVQSARIAETLRKAVEAGPIMAGPASGAAHEIRVTASLGVAVIDETTRSTLTSAGVLVSAAAQAVGAAKSAGRNCARVFSVPARTAKVA